MNRKQEKNMKTLKVYGVYGMVEKSMAIDHNGVRLSLMFTGGGATANGVTPARYSTDNAVYQRIIEGSRQYASGYIRLVRSTRLPEAGDGAGVQAPAASGVDGEDNGGLTLVYVPNIESDGKRYLIDNFGVKAGSLRSKSQIIREAERNGVRFTTRRE